MTCRAVHQLTDRPLIFEDPCALQIVGPAREQEIRNDPHRIGFKVLAGRLARVGEPFIGFFDPLAFGSRGLAAFCARERRGLNRLG